MIALEPGKTTLRNVHLRADGDPLALKLRLARLLDAADFGTAGLPPEACLVVRNLGDPLPGRLRLAQNALLPHPAWERAMRQALETQARQAARPALGPVDADAPAILFADRAELLACAARALLNGTLHSNWWWQSIFPNTALSRAVLSAWQDSPEQLPAALAQLTQRGDALAFLHMLDRAMTHHLLTGMLQTFGLPALLQVFQAPPVSVDATTYPTPIGLSAPWHFVWPFAETGLQPEAQALLGTALALQQAPSQTRTLHFAEQARDWYQNAVANSLPAAMPVAQPPQEAHTVERLDVDITDQHSSATETLNNPGQPAESTPFSLPQGGKAEIEGPSPFIAFANQAAGSENSPAHDQPAMDIAPQAGAAESVEPAFVPLQVNSQTPTSATSEMSPFASVVDAAPLAEIVETRFGGVFYLLNLALLLGLYADFGAPLNPGLALSPWDFLALLGRELVGPEFERDPLWSLLARLAGRASHQQPGQGFEPPEDLSFALWLEQTSAQVRLQLQLLLRLEQPSALRDLLFVQSARIQVSSTRLDIFFSLAEHPIQIRLAGLDRDPWWIPAAGHYVVYHYD